MNKLINKLLGLNVLIQEMTILKNEVLVLEDENKALKKALAYLTEKVEEMESPDCDDFVREDDIDSKIEDYLYQNDYTTVDKVAEMLDEQDIDSIVEKVAEELDLESKTASKGEQDIEEKVTEAVKVTLERMVKALADQQD